MPTTRSSEEVSRQMSHGGTLELDRPPPDTLRVRLTGTWRLHERLPSAGEIDHVLAESRDLRRVVFDTSGIIAWDSGLLTFVRKLMHEGKRRGIEVDRDGLPEGAQHLLNLATAVEAGAAAMLLFIGQACLAFWALLRRRARFQSSDLWLIVEECGARALPIVTLICFLVGLILAFVGSVQLRRFGAQIYVADLVGIAMAQEIGAMMTGIILAGRTGG